MYKQRGHNFQKICISFSEDRDCIAVANIVDHDEMPHDVTFHLGLHCLSKYPFKVSGLQKVKGAYVLIRVECDICYCPASQE